MKKRRTAKEFVKYNDYDDRLFGQKWGTAFAIEELNQAIDINKNLANKVVMELRQMERSEIDDILQLAFLKSHTISIQLNDRDENNMLKDSIIGKFQGFADTDNIYINEQALPWESIRNIKII